MNTEVKARLVDLLREQRLYDTQILVVLDAIDRAGREVRAAEGVPDLGGEIPADNTYLLCRLERPQTCG